MNWNITPLFVISTSIMWKYQKRMRKYHSLHLCLLVILYLNFSKIIVSSWYIHIWYGAMLLSLYLSSSLSLSLYIYRYIYIMHRLVSLEVISFHQVFDKNKVLVYFCSYPESSWYINISFSLSWSNSLSIWQK